MWASDPSKVTIKPSTEIATEYFSLGLNCIKNSKSLLRRMFESQNPNLQGVYFVRIFQGNIWKYVIIDDNIPVVEVKEGKKIKYNPLFITTDSAASSKK